MTEEMSIVYLAACALHGIAPDEEKIKGIDLKRLYKISSHHSIAAIVCMALETTELFQGAEPELKKRWQDAKNKAVRKNILMDAERGQLLSWMDDHQIWYMPLKGSILKNLYPKTGMRQMADNDILFDANHQYDVRDYMVAHGYDVISVAKGNHDVYEKAPVYNFEMHTALFGILHNPSWRSYYANVRERLQKDEGNACGYHFSDEDFYVYFLAHMAKHYQGGGTGVRSLMDIYVYNWKKGDSLDRDYIRQETDKLELSRFEQQCRGLSEKLFGQPENFEAVTLSDEEKEIFAYVYGSGTYGTLENRVRNELGKLQPEGGKPTLRSKLTYCRGRFFPSIEFMEHKYPIVIKCKLLLPLAYVWRMISRGIVNHKKLQSEMKNLRKV